MLLAFDMLPGSMSRARSISASLYVKGKEHICTDKGLSTRVEVFALAAGPLSGYRMHSALTHACVTIQTFKDPFIRGIETLQLNAPVRLKACNAMGSAYQSFKLPYVESECGETLHIV